MVNYLCLFYHYQNAACVRHNAHYALLMPHGNTFSYIFRRAIFAHTIMIESLILFNILERMGNRLGTILNQFQVSKENLTKLRFAPETIK